MAPPYSILVHRRSYWTYLLNSTTYTPDPESQPWVESCMQWLAAEATEDSMPASVHRLRPPDEPHWSLDLTEAFIAYLELEPPILPATSGATSQDSSPADQEESDSAAGKSPLTNIDADLDQASLRRLRLKQFALTLTRWQLQLLHQQEAGQAEAALVVAEQMARVYRLIYRWKIAGVEGPLLIGLSVGRSDLALKILVEILIHWPPHEWNATAQALGPLIAHRDWSLNAVFPKIFEALQHPSTIASVLDLANYCRRKEMTLVHPAKEILPSLLNLLGGTVGRLGKLEEDPRQFGYNVAEVQRILDESISLCVALCDTVSWCEDASAIGKLNQAMQLSHRRVKVEAACALARLGDEIGKKTLIELAADPMCRLRAIQYATELGFEEEIDETWRLPQSIAEGELVAWLAQPSQMGLAPHEVELIDERTCFWPGYHDPQTAYLFRYEYQFPDAKLSNIGIAGPIVHSFAADLADLPEDDIYAAFAGWTAEHQEIYEVPVDEATAAQYEEMGRLKRFLENEDYEEVQVLFLGFLVHERSLVAYASKNETQGVVVTDGLETLWLPTQGRIRPLGPLEVYSIFKGRKLLRTFNS